MGDIKFDKSTSKASAIFFKFIVVATLLPVSYLLMLGSDTPEILDKSSCVQPFSARNAFIFSESIKIYPFLLTSIKIYTIISTLIPKLYQRKLKR
nr:hypothetical protein [Campylobacter sp. RM13119]